MSTVLNLDNVNIEHREEDCRFVKKEWFRPKLFLLKSTIDGHPGAGSDLGCVPNVACS